MNTKDHEEPLAPCSGKKEKYMVNTEGDNTSWRKEEQAMQII